MPVRKKENIIIYVGWLEKKKNKNYNKPFNREKRNLNMQLYSSRHSTADIQQQMKC